MLSRIMELFAYGISSSLNKLSEKDRVATMHRPKWHRFVSRRLEAAIYPRSMGYTLFDRYITAFIILSIILLFAELIANPVTAEKLSYTSCFFLAVFGTEFLLRFYLKGFGYFRFWGVIDMLVILGDLAVVISLIAGPELLGQVAILGIQPETIAPILRIVRLLRLLRIVKLFVQLSKGRSHIRRLALRVFPIVARLGLAIIASLALALLTISISSLFIGAEVFDSVANFMSLVARGLFQSSGIVLTEGEQLKSLSEAVESTAALVAILAITTIITQVFVAMLSTSRRPTKEEVLSSFVGHVVIYVNDLDRLGYLEEIRYLFERVAGYDLIFIVRPDLEEDFAGVVSDQTNAFVGTLFETETWHTASIHRSFAVITLGETRIGDAELRAMALATSSDRGFSGITILQLSNAKRYSTTTLDGLHRSRVVKVPIGCLEREIERHIWRTGSTTSASYHAVCDALGIGRQTSVLSGVPEASEGRFEEDERLDFLDAEPGVKVEIQSATHLVWFEEEADEDREVFVLAKLLQVLSGHPSKSSIYLFVRSLGLRDWEELFKDAGHEHVRVLALELIVALAIYHELVSPEATLSWFNKAGAKRYKSLSFMRRSRFVTREQLRAELKRRDGEDGSLVAVRNAANKGNVRVWVNGDSDRVRVSAEDEILFLRA